MSDYELKRIINLTEASSYGDADYLAVDGANGTKKLSKAKLIEGAVTPAISNLSGVFDNVIAGNAKQLLGSMSVLDTEPYQFRTTGGSSDVGDREFLSITGGTVAWNQLVKNGNFAEKANWTGANCTYEVSNNVATLTITGAAETAKQFYQTHNFINGHKMLCIVDVKPSSNTTVMFRLDDMPGSPNKSCTANTWTQVCGIKSMTRNATNGDVNIYGMASLQSGDTVQIKDAVLIDLTQMFGTTIADYIYSLEQATAGAGVAWFRKYFPKDYYAYHAPSLEHVTGLSKHVTVGFNAYDKTTGKAKVVGGNEYEVVGAYTGLSLDGTTITPVNNKFTPPHSGELTVTGGDSTTCVHLTWSGYRNGEYEPYVKHTYPLDSTLTLRGVPVLRDGKLEFDGDVYKADGTVERRYGLKDLGVLDWGAGDGFFYASYGYKKEGNNNIICAKYVTSTSTSAGAMSDKEIKGQNGTHNIYLKDSSYSDAASLKAALNGVYALYELTTPTTESADPFTSPQECDDFGTEEFVTTSIVPVGHETSYPANLRDKVQHLPDSTGTAGMYLISEDSQEHQSLSQFPMPATDGTYTLKCTKSGSTVSMSWVADE